MGIRAFLRPLAYKILARDQDPDSFLDRISGIIHVGANTGQERELYASNGLPVLWVEPIPDVYEKLVSNLRNFPNQLAVQALLYDRDGVQLSLNIANNGGASSSIMDFKDHKLLWPEVNYVNSIEMTTKTLASLVREIQLDLTTYNSIVLDTQGSELLILKGAIPLLSSIAYVKTEVPDFEAYLGCPMLPEFTSFMKDQGFRLVSRRAQAESTSSRAYFDVTYQNIKLANRA
jgi:FkbM family methyltransferase